MIVRQLDFVELFLGRTVTYFTFWLSRLICTAQLVPGL